MYLYEFSTCLARIIQIVQGTKGHIAVYGPVCHPQNIIWTEAKLKNRPVTPKYYMDRSEAKLRSIYYFGILGVTDRIINCHLAALIYTINPEVNDTYPPRRMIRYSPYQHNPYFHII